MSHTRDCRIDRMHLSLGFPLLFGSVDMRRFFFSRSSPNTFQDVLNHRKKAHFHPLLRYRFVGITVSLHSAIICISTLEHHRTSKTDYCRLRRLPLKVVGAPLPLKFQVLCYRLGSLRLRIKELLNYIPVSWLIFYYTYTDTRNGAVYLLHDVYLQNFVNDKIKVP